MRNYSVYVIILNYNHVEDLKETIMSFLQQDYQNLHIIVSDNGSKDDSIEWLKRNYSDIIVLENNENLGWAEGNNVGIRYALEQGADYILLANNDIHFNDTSLIQRMVYDLEQLKRFNVSIVGTSVNYYFDKELTHNQGWIIYPKGEKRGHFFNKFRKNCFLELDKKYKIVDSVDGCFFLISSDVFRNIGLFKKELFMYADEIDFSIRAWENGFKSVVNTNLTIYHKVGSSSIPNSPFSTYYRNRNLLLLIKLHGNSIRYLIVYFKDVMKALFKNIFTSSKTIHHKLEIQNAIFRGVFDGLFNRLGKRY